ncbi:hypothetical protein [Streptomyces sp. NPDC127038]|uniref:hypothetical protein n=1 Tax=Streptomyces sp. NPDC127038 TaxID=3347114 RepID=UPI0036595B71
MTHHPGVPRHPLAVGPHGGIALSLACSGPADSPTVVLGLHADARHAGTAAMIEVELLLVESKGNDVLVVLANSEHLMAVGAGLPIGWQRPDRTDQARPHRAVALIVAEPADRNRFVVSLTGLGMGTGQPRRSARVDLLAHTAGKARQRRLGTVPRGLGPAERAVVFAYAEGEGEATN